MWSETNIWAKIKYALVAVLAVLALIIFVNNTDAVPFNLIFGEVHLPLILLLLAVLLVGMLMGVLLSVGIRRRRERKREAE